MTDYPYDPDLPYVVEIPETGRFIARFADRGDADHAVLQAFSGHVIDTTPKPRVPDDAKFITWWDGDDPSGLNASNRWYAARVDPGWLADDGAIYDRLNSLPGVTPDTVFTVLDERKS